MTLTLGNKYDLATLIWTGWTKGDGSEPFGYNASDYFIADGIYLGPDKHGIEPTFVYKEL